MGGGGGRGEEIKNLNKMAINTYLSTTESKKISEQAEQKQTNRYREHFGGCQIGWGLGGWVKG